MTAPAGRRNISWRWLALPSDTALSLLVDRGRTSRHCTSSTSTDAAIATLGSFFRALLVASRAPSIEVQSNDGLATVMLHAFAPHVTSEAILFHDKVTTTHAP